MPGPGIKLESGHVLDERYLLESVIGEGGMGTVFAARHLELGDMVAVKVLQSESAVATLEAEHLERFLREARVCAKIKNEHVVRIIDVARGKNGFPPYIVMELLDGIDLGDLVRSLGRVRMTDAIDYVLQACEGLAEAHALGIVHRDLKASNLHVSKRGDGSPIVKVLDFGISKMAEEGESVHLTTTSAVFGSPAYMSPEQIRSAKHVDARTDVWALNVVLYELLTGQLPFTGDNAGAMLASVSADPYIPLRKHLPEAPDGLERAIHAAFVKDRDKRTPSVQAFAESIAPFGASNAKVSLAAIQRTAQRISTRSLPAPAMVEPATVPTPSARGGPVSDTVAVASPVTTGDPDEIDTAPLPKVAAPAPSAREAIVRTDREMVVPMSAPGATSTLAIVAAVGASLLAIGVVALVLFVRSRSIAHLDHPAPPPPAVAATPGPAAPPGSASAPPLPAATEAAPLVSLELPAAPAVPARRPSRTPPPRPSAKPNHGIDTSHRE